MSLSVLRCLRSCWTPASSLLALSAATLGAAAPTIPLSLGAQPNRPAVLTVRGRVTGPDSQPVVGALVRLLAAGAPGDSTRTDAAGTYELADRRGAALVLRVRVLGFQPVDRPVDRPATGTVATINVRLQKTVTTLAAVKVQENRTLKPTIANDFPSTDPGSTPQYAAGGLNSGDAGNLAAMATSIPGVTLTPSTDGGMPGFSVLGLGAAQNNVTLNGVSFGGAQIPAAAMTMTRLQTTSFDPSVGGFSGGLLSLTMFRGSNWKSGRVAFTVDDPSLQWTDATGSALGQRSRNLQGSASRSGPIVHDKLFYNVAAQIGRRSSDLTTLGDADAGALAAVGVSVDAEQQLFDALDALGVPAPRTGADVTSTRSGSLLARFDILPTQKRSLNVTFNGAWSATGPSLLGPTALPTHGGETRTHSAGAQLEHAHYVKDRFASRTRSGLSFTGSHSAPLATLPDGQVLVGSQLADGRAGLATLQFGGASAASRENAAWFWETNHEDSWYVGKKHLLKVAGGLRLDGYTNEPRANEFGTFTFNSLDALRAGRAASYTRSLGGWRTHGDAQSGWASVGDLLRPTDRLTFQYGLRGEANRYGRLPAYNAAIDSLFGARTDAAPTTWAVSPRAGVSWVYGHRKAKVGQFFGPGGMPRGALRGGIGMFRGALAPTLLAPALNGTGLPGALQRLTCVGPAAPVPSWDAYAASVANIPTTCADGTTAFADTRPAVTLFRPGYDAPRSWRATAGWSVPGIFGRFFLTADATVTRSDRQPGTLDLNFGGPSRFTLDGEAGRAVFTDVARIDPATGAVDPLGARATSRYSRVSALTSDLHARSEQLNVRVGPSGGFFLTRFWGLSYSMARVRDEARGFDGAAFGDPRVTTWAPSVGDIRHTFGGNLYWSLGQDVSFNLSGQLRSGMPFTPIVTGDVNGDGNGANDRAFVFAPSAASDAPLQQGMRELLATAPPAIRACLTRQLGQAAARNSCRGPWSASLNASFGVQGHAVRLPDGSYLSFTIANPLAGIDQVLHGSTNLRGWGQPALPNPVLLVVKGFDPTMRAFRYTVNPAFGDARPARSAVRAPTQLTINVSVPITPPFARQQLESVVEPGRKWGGKKLTAAQIKQQYMNFGFFNPMPPILAAKDSLLLTKAQLVVLDSIGKRYTASLDSAWSGLATDIAALPEHYDRAALMPRVRDAKIRAWDALATAAKRLGVLLTPDQKQLLAPEIAQMLDERTIARMRRSDIRVF